MAGRCSGQCGAAGDEQVRVGGVRPALVAVGDVGGQAYPDRFGELDGAAGQVEAALREVAGVGEGEVADLAGAHGLEGEQGGDGSPVGVGAGEGRTPPRPGEKGEASAGPGATALITKDADQFRVNAYRPQTVSLKLTSTGLSRA